jgi:hypothetical protein
MGNLRGVATDGGTPDLALCFPGKTIWPVSTLMVRLMNKATSKRGRAASLSDSATRFRSPTFPCLSNRVIASFHGGSPFKGFTPISIQHQGEPPKIGIETLVFDRPS